MITANIESGGRFLASIVVVGRMTCGLVLVVICDVDVLVLLGNFGLVCFIE